MRLAETAFLAAAALAMAVPVIGAARSEKKLIEYGQGFPDTTFYREHVREMEKVGFDGVVLRVAKGKTEWSLGYKVFTKDRLDPRDIEGPIADLKAVKSSVLTENFIQVAGAMPADVDWFDPAWDSVPHNAALMARVAKMGGCRGLMIDPEEYGPNKPWSYREFPPELKLKHTFDEYSRQVRQRGREFIRAVNREYPDVSLLFLLGPSFTYMRCRVRPRDETAYSLLTDFIDGICEAAAPGTTVIDGYEQSYGYRQRAFFQKARNMILNDTRAISAVPDQFRRHIRAGFGVWVDNKSGSLGWHPSEIEKNYYTPDEFRNTLAWALEASDRYVWVWSEQPRWWTGEKMPPAYVQALKAAKQGPAVVKERDYPLPVPEASTLGGYSDKETFAGFYQTLQEKLDLPKTGWMFARDPNETGVKLGWQSVEFDDSSWRTISIGRFWENQGENYDGTAWYRRSVHLPNLPTDKRVFLAVGAADESASVYVNGKYAGCHDIGEAGWDQPFLIDITDAVKRGKPNLFAFRVTDTGGPGGLWKSVKVMVER